MTQREAALSGPRSLKTPGSPEWCWQTIESLKNSLSLLDQRWQQAEQVVDDLRGARAWEKIPPENPYGSLDELLKAETGLGESQIYGQIHELRMKDQRDKAGQRAGGGQPGNSNAAKDKSTVNNIDSRLERPRGTSQSANLRRLRKDRPDLHARVLAGELSSNAAMIEAGFSPHRVQVRTDSVESIAKTLRRYLDPVALKELAELLAEGEKT